MRFCLTPFINKPSLIFVVHFSGPPLPPINVSITDCANHTTNVTWNVRLTPDLDPPSGFIIEWRIRARENSYFRGFSRLSVIGRTRLFVLKNLKAYIKIQFRVRARNRHGIGFPGYMAPWPTCVTNSKSKYRRII